MDSHGWLALFQDIDAIADAPEVVELRVTIDAYIKRDRTRGFRISVGWDLDDTEANMVIGAAVSRLAQAAGVLVVPHRSGVYLR